MPPTTPSQPMTYHCQGAVLRFFTFEKRQKMVKKCPALAGHNNTLAFNLRNVEYSYDYHWSDRVLRTLFERPPGSKIIKFSIDYFEWEFKIGADFVTMKIPSGKVFTLAGKEEIVADLVNFYLDRPHTSIENFYVKNYNGAVPFPSNYAIRIKNLIMEISAPDGYKRGFLSSFEGNKFHRIAIDDQSRRLEFVDELKKLKTDKLKLWFHDQSFGNRFLEFGMGVLKVRENDPECDRFVEVCKEFKAGRCAIESSYKGFYPVTPDFDSYELWNQLKEELNCQERYFQDGQCLTTPIANMNAEVNIKVHKVPRLIESYMLSAHVSEVGSAKTLWQLGPLNIIKMLTLGVYSLIMVPMALLNNLIYTQIFHRPPRHHIVFAASMLYSVFESYRTDSEWFSIILLTALLRIYLWLLVTPFITPLEPYFVELNRRYELLPPRRSVDTLLHTFCLFVNLMISWAWVGHYFPDETFYHFGYSEILFLIYEMMVFF